MRWLLGILIVLIAAYFVARSFITIFVVQPIGAVPDGVTAVIWKGEDTQFIDSADAICARKMGGVSLLCRGAALSGVVNGNEILLRLPYSEYLYLLSTGGKTYER